MKGSLAFDPRDYDYGPATEAVRSVLAEWLEIDWFEPGAGDADHAASLFREHQRLAHAQSPELFASEIDLRVITGDRQEFVSWCQRVRGQAGWDWKFSVLKKLGVKHAKARAWSDEEQAHDLRVGSPRPGDLFFRLPPDANGRQVVLWQSVVPVPADLGTMTRDGFGDAARFYISYAQSDAHECMKWQLAERAPDMSSNPFLPLLLCYEAGAYPFSLGPNSVVLFRFDGEPRTSN
jgi:hypothetical protein